MEPIKVTAIFDIGKTNKKFFLFDQDLKEVYKVYHRLDYIQDEDGDDCESIQALTQWVKQTLKEALALPQFLVIKLNFTTYGASFVHIDQMGNPVAPLYNYLKKYPDVILEQFYKKYGPAEKFSRETSSPALAMLNSGLQLYWLKNSKPQTFKKIHRSLHLPQYLSFLFTGKAVSEYTSIGCHTGLWDFAKGDYHHWVKAEGIDRLLPEVVDTTTSFPKTFDRHSMSIGVGVHDSSSALLPYLNSNSEPFALLSTGTWAISINPFNASPLTTEELRKDCLHFLSKKGQPIKISRLFIGEEHKVQIEKLYAYFQLERGYYKALSFEKKLYQKAKSKNRKRFRFEYLKPEVYGLTHATATDWKGFADFEDAYYSFIHELTDLQVASLSLVLNGDTSVKKLYIDGGFNANPIFVEMLRDKLSGISIETTDFALGTALGAGILVN
ncbi:Rhamnulokinase RhaK in alpha-proteobacteria [Indibacter alkaliphilus LW1]|uniref:Rhamnulokinase RhaK in alpha-proteobacteria n=1 Tax=Indibacter alkaliphilus (strain CCUG 57479 / KCTC 22604 / LW1) TaxID=1189612 RepID=S2D8X4_INDAL|nr:FGGY family carbohydrate kinase [Indibacter alkaliphilus]EOZ93485.1 Rhamnulokinase RhaK in alpha-proteobacteria [Indibacter alkaliphilus LW1]